MRTGLIERTSRETDIRVSIDLDGSGKAEADTGIGFFDHMLDAFARFSLCDISVRCRGDLQVDSHHTVEDTGICLGQAIRQALGSREGIHRVGSAYLPMDESLAFAAIDISGRPYVVFNAAFTSDRVGQYDTQLAEEFFRAVAVNAGLTVHLKVEGRNDHHQLEALHKAFGLALREAAALDPRVIGVPSTKGCLD